ncbi:hypothetical protein FISHEDRAFT_52242 [Fistulina hepatica ATCC 64428]|nr:hypothetical protein FISHEDRAFT_52242 [Fistulina hepatica ATCC 64428]
MKYRILDPCLGVCSGLLAYYLFETHPRTALPEERRLLNLLKWKWGKRWTTTIAAS